MTTKQAPRQRWRKHRNSLEYHDSIWGYCFIMPIFLGFLIITIAPIITTFIFSLTDKNMLRPDMNFVGFKNYSDLLGDITFQATIRQTLQFTLLLLPANVIISLLLAALLKDKFKGCGFFRTAVFTPVVISVTVWGVLWRYIFQTDNGLVNSLLKMGIGMNMVIFIAALQDVPSEFLEAAALDGASKPRRFFSVTLPCISPSIFLVLILTTINSLRVFAQIKALTNGGPGTSSYVMVYYIYQMAFGNYKFGLASAASVILFLIIVLLTVLQWNMRKRWVYHED